LRFAPALNDNELFVQAPWKFREIIAAVLVPSLPSQCRGRTLPQKATSESSPLHFCYFEGAQLAIFPFLAWATESQAVVAVSMLQSWLGVEQQTDQFKGH
jgi:hypothetical protein